MRKNLVSVCLLSCVCLLPVSASQPEQPFRAETRTELAVPNLSPAKSVLNEAVLDLAAQGYQRLYAAGRLTKPRWLTVIDMSRSANAERLFIIDTETGTPVYSSLVAHGKGSGSEFAQLFSNTENSFQTSLGFYVTAETYTGKHGHSLRLDGTEPSNSNARHRDIVMHQADYVSSEYVRQFGRLGRSHGCPALPVTGYREVIDRIEGGSCLFIYHPDSDYRATSPLLNG